MRHRGGAKLPTRDSLMHHPAGSPWCSPVAQSGGTEVQILTIIPLLKLLVRQAAPGQSKTRVKYN